MDSEQGPCFSKSGVVARKRNSARAHAKPKPSQARRARLVSIISRFCGAMRPDIAHDRRLFGDDGVRGSQGPLAHRSPLNRRLSSSLTSFLR